MISINLELSTESINKAIADINAYRELFDDGVGEVVNILTEEGTEVAQAAFGSMANATAIFGGKTTGMISVSGKAPGVAEFGAGYATMEYHPLAKNAPYPVKVASFSEENLGLFYITNDLYPGEGYWIFGWSFGGKGKFGKPNYFDRIQPRHGLLDAYDYINTHSTEVAKEVFGV